MKRFRIFLFFLLTSSSLLASDLKLVVQSPSGERVAGVQVSLYVAKGNSGVGILTTAGDGMVTFSNLADGAYHAEILAPGFAAQSLQVSVPRSEPLTIELKLATSPQTVVVSATATPDVASQTGASLDFLNSSQLTLLNPPAAADALSYIPGAIVNTSGRRGSQASLFVRGGESSYNKVLIDGVPVNDPGGFYDFGVTPMNNVERMEVVRGPESTIYGTDAMTSVVQLWTTTGTTLKPQFEFGADGGTFSTANGYVSVAGADKIFDYNFFLNQFDTDGQGINDSYSNALQGGNVGIRFSPRVALRLRLRHSNNWTGVQSNWWFNGNAVLPPNTNQLAHQNNFLASAELAVSGPSAWQHTFTGFEYNHLQENSQQYVDPGREFIDSPFSNLSKYNRAGFSYQGQWTPRPWAQTTVGYTFDDENGHITSNFAPGTDFASFSNTTGLRFNNYLYAQELIVCKRMAALLGVGYVNNTSFGSKVVPRVSVSYLLLRGNAAFSGTRLRAGYSEGIKEPSFLQSFGISGTYPVLPNPDLQPEQNRSWEAGFEQGFWGNKLSLSALYYSNQFHNQIEFQTNPVDFTSQYVNLNKSMAHGAEIELRGQMGAHFSLTGAYTYTSTRIQEAPPCNPPFCDPLIYGVGAPLLRRPKQAGTLLLTYVRSRFGATLGVVAIGRRPDSDFLFGLIPPIYYAAGYARMDLGGWYNLTRHVTMYANVNNALNNHYNEVLGYPAMKANFRAGMRFRFGGE
ncbi:MAG TPA: TonB-dependent receptor [Candidatus Eisenbacteria bacterium]|nr:TonB-dependent receptor [Candidatus Eisenbacteria bacterium]